MLSFSIEEKDFNTVSTVLHFVLNPPIPKEFRDKKGGFYW